VPKRAANLLGLLRSAGVANLRGLRVLEAGCGFGALAAYLAWAEAPAAVVAVDIRDDYLGPGRQAARILGMPEERLRFVRGDLRAVDTVVGDGFDVVVANNALLYLNGRGDLDSALAALARALRPGGIIAIYQANRWRRDDPFTHAPVVHLLPRRAADVLARRRGWRHSHDRVRLVSPPALALRLRRAGFGALRITGFHADARRNQDLRRLFSSFFAITARRR
jgi:SAM-dependent methyltransferase